MAIWTVIAVILAALTGYLLGSLNSSLIVSRFYGMDIRQHGSGNAGMTNTLRVLGKKAALFVLTGDLLKGILAYLAGYFLFGTIMPAIAGNFTFVAALGGMIGGTASIIGHILPVFFGFKGGKGVLTTLAVLFMIDWQAALILLGLFVLIVAVTRYVSLGSVVGAILLPVTEIVLGRGTANIIFAILIAILVVYMHQSNIKRLINGNESKLGAKKQGV